MKKGKESQEDKEVGGMKQYMLLVFFKALYVGVYDNLWGDSDVSSKGKYSWFLIKKKKNLKAYK